MLSENTPSRASLGLLDREMRRRDFLKFCTMAAAAVGLPLSVAEQFAEAAVLGKKPSVIWLHFQECTGCTESLLRAYHPTARTLILDMISLDYHEALCAGAGHQAEAYRAKSMKENWGKFVLVVDGSIPTKDGGVYCMVAGKPIWRRCGKRPKGRRRSSPSVPAPPGAACPPAIPIRPTPSRCMKCCPARP
jgi:NiFe hydrogenase small subunit HydA